MTTATDVRVELDDDGHWVRAWVPSRTRLGAEYEMVRYPSGWAHADTTCRGWVDRGACYHTKACEEANMVTEQEETTKAITVQLSPLALMDEVDLEMIMNSKLTPVPEWIYSFQLDGQTVTGIGAKGVSDAARALFTQGEAIRCIKVELERETEEDGYFMATAQRFAISPTGEEVPGDQQVRAKRQPKHTVIKKTGEKRFNRFWYEIGTTKAARNAVESLLPAALRTFMKEQAKQLLAASKGHDIAQPGKARVVENVPPKERLTNLINGLSDAIYNGHIQTWKEQFPKLFNVSGTMTVTKITDAEAEQIADLIEGQVNG